MIGVGAICTALSLAFIYSDNTAPWWSSALGVLAFFLFLAAIPTLVLFLVLWIYSVVKKKQQADAGQVHENE